MPSPFPRLRRILSAALLLGLCLAAAPTGAAAHEEAEDEIERLPGLGVMVAGLSAPDILEPHWIAADALPPVDQEVRFRVTSTGDVDTDLDDFAEAVTAIFDDPRGWRRAGVSFTFVEDGPADVTVALATASGVESYGAPCSAAFSCRVGDDVIINEERWNEASDSWNDTEASLLDYRRMVANHEMGHWLGHGHYDCEDSDGSDDSDGSNEPAPLMQQQSKSLQGCEPNPWPLEFELDLTDR